MITGIKEIGSMIIQGIYKDLNLKDNLKKILDRMKDLRTWVVNASVEMFRMTQRSKALSLVLGLIGIGGFATLLASMPRVNAYLRMAHTYVRLIGLTMDKYWAPVAEKIKDLTKWIYEKYKNSPDWLQRLIADLLLAGFLLAPIVFGLIAMGKITFSGLLAKLGSVVLWLGKVAGAFGGAVAGSLLLQIAVGILLGVLGVMALDKLGVLDWLSDLGKGFRDRREEGDLLANAVTAILGPIGLLGDAVMVLIGTKSWADLKADFKTWQTSIDTLVTKFGDLKKAVKDLTGVSLPEWLINPLGASALSVAKSAAKHDVGGMATYTGLHWLQAGETVNMRGVQGSSSGGNNVTINNYLSGPIQLQNGMDIDEFADLISRKQAEKMAWRSK